MAKQLVLRGNRVLSHGEDCFLCAGGAVICPETGRTFENATVVNHPGEIPSDIDEVGYEYHAGAFVPCAPFGKGGGNIAVVCNEDCKSIKDSGYLLPNYANWKLTASGAKFLYLIGSPSNSYTELFSSETQAPGSKFAQSGFRALVGGTVKVLYRCKTSSTHFVLYMQVNDEEPEKINLDVYHNDNTLKTITHEISVKAGGRYTFYFDYRTTNSDFSKPLRLAEFSIYANAPDVSVIADVWSDATESDVAIIDPMAQLRADVDYLAAQAGVTL